MRKIFFVMGLLLGVSSAYAARTAIVDVDAIDLLTVPKPKAASILKLKKGTKLAASNYPTEGYYKVRTSDGTLGWVKADTLELGPMPDLTPKKKK